MIQHKTQKGSLLVGILIFSSVALVVITGIVSWFSITIKATRTTTDRELAFQIAEAGIDYYRWHLAHAPQDFRDGYIGEEETGGGGDEGGDEEIVYTTSIEIEAESVSDQSLFSPFVVETDSLASGGEYIVWPNNGNNQYNSESDPNLDGQGNYVFYLTDTADVRVDVTYRFDSDPDNSFRYILNEGTWYKFYGQETGVWESDEMHQYQSLGAGQHVLKILRREDGARIDKFTLTVTNGDGLLSTEAPPVTFSSPATSPPQDGLVMWLDAADVNGNGTSPSANEDIDDWQDKSPRNNDMRKWQSRSVPQMREDGGSEAVYFSDDHLRSNKRLYPVRPTQDTDIFAVVRVSDDNGGAFFDTNKDRVRVYLPNDSDNNIRWDFGGSSNRLETDWNFSEGEYYIWNFQASSTQGQMIRQDGSVLATGGNTDEVDDSRRIYLGTESSNNNEHEGLYVKEFIVYDQKLTEVERIETERYLRCKWVIGDQEDCTEPEPESNPTPEEEQQLGLPGETYGPFVHDFYDKNGILVGQFVLMITAPELGSTVVTVQSTGTLINNPEIKRTILSRLAIPSFAKYSFVSNDTMRFGEGTVVRGPIHSNGGIRFDGVAHNVVTSSRESYDDPDHSGPNEFGVHTHVGVNDPYPPATVPSRPDVFVAGREFPVPAVDFAGVTLDLAELKALAQQPAGHYIAASSGVGYRIDIKTDDTFDLYEVATFAPVPHWSCGDYANEDDWGTWSIGSESFINNYSLPQNGVIFVEDHVWVEGQLNTAKVTIGAGRFPDTPSTHRNIILHDDLEYTFYDGQDVIGLVAQGNIHVPLFSPDMLKVDAAMIAQSGRIGRNYYRAPGSYTYCGSTAERDTIEIHGMIGSAQRYGFAWTDGTGYENRLIDYDPELLYSPPPSFPLTSDAYETIWWEEVKVDDDFEVIGQGI